MSPIDISRYHCGCAGCSAPTIFRVFGDCCVKAHYACRRHLSWAIDNVSHNCGRKNSEVAHVSQEITP